MQLVGLAGVHMVSVLQACRFEELGGHCGFHQDFRGKYERSGGNYPDGEDPSLCGSVWGDVHWNNGRETIVRNLEMKKQ
jgi:hypothetical protein